MQAQNMTELGSHETLRGKFVSLDERGRLPDGSEYLIISPLGKPLGGGNKPWVCFHMTLQLCTTVRDLAKEDLLHGDISYGNATFTDRVLLLDLLTVKKISEVLPLFLQPMHMCENPSSLSCHASLSFCGVPVQ